MEQYLALIVGKPVKTWQESGLPASDTLEVGGRYSARYREAGWRPGLKILTALANTLETLALDDRAR